MIPRQRIWSVVVFATLLLAASLPAAAQVTAPFLTLGPAPAMRHDPTIPARCNGPIKQVIDVGFEGVRTTAWNWGAVGGGGETGRFDPTPVLSTQVNLQAGCLNAHLSAMTGSAQTYPGVSPVTMFQVTLTNAMPPAAPMHMYGHFETPYGIYGPAVATEAERDVDTFGANFFQTIGPNPTDVPPGLYRVDVWWAGGPTAPGGAIGGPFVLKLYQY